MVYRWFKKDNIHPQQQQQNFEQLVTLGVTYKKKKITEKFHFCFFFIFSCQPLFLFCFFFFFFFCLVIVISKFWCQIISRIIVDNQQICSDEVRWWIETNRIWLNLREWVNEWTKEWMNEWQQVSGWLKRGKKKWQKTLFSPSFSRFFFFFFLSSSSAVFNWTPEDQEGCSEDLYLLMCYINRSFKHAAQQSGNSCATKRAFPPVKVSSQLFYLCHCLTALGALTISPPSPPLPPPPLPPLPPTTNPMYHHQPTDRLP